LKGDKYLSAGQMPNIFRPDLPKPSRKFRIGEEKGQRILLDVHPFSSRILHEASTLDQETWLSSFGYCHGQSSLSYPQPMGKKLEVVALLNSVRYLR